MVNLLRQIVQRNPPITNLIMERFSDASDHNENIGELVLENLLNSNIDKITNLDLSYNKSWFKQR